MFSLNIKAILLAGVTALVAIMGAALWVQTARLQSADTAFDALSARHEVLAEAHNRALERAAADRRTLLAREAKIASQARKLAEAQEGLQKALQANSDWSDTHVPTDVQNALVGRSGDPDSAPGVRRDGQK